MHAPVNPSELSACDLPNSKQARTLHSCRSLTAATIGSMQTSPTGGRTEAEHMGTAGCPAASPLLGPRAANEGKHAVVLGRHAWRVGFPESNAPQAEGTTPTRRCAPLPCPAASRALPASPAPPSPAVTTARPRRCRREGSCSSATWRAPPRCPCSSTLALYRPSTAARHELSPSRPRGRLQGAGNATQADATQADGSTDGTPLAHMQPRRVQPSISPCIPSHAYIEEDCFEAVQLQAEEQRMEGEKGVGRGARGAQCENGAAPQTLGGAKGQCLVQMPQCLEWGHINSGMAKIQKRNSARSGDGGGGGPIVLG